MMARMNWDADRRRRLPARSIKDETDNVNNDAAAKWLGSFLGRGFRNDPRSPAPRWGTKRPARTGRQRR
jgi:hypothetical protein